MAILAATPPLLAFIFFWGLAAAHVYRQRRRGAWRPYGEAFLLAALAWGVCVTVITQGLSLWRALTSVAVGSCWIVLTLASACVMAGALMRWRRAGVSEDDGLQATLPQIAIPGKGAGVWYISLAITVLILATTGVIAKTVPPNNWDAMTYHLSRVQHWIQNGSVGFYPTNDPRQLFDPPWAEYAILQFQLLTGGDGFANFVQWFSGLGSCVCAPLIAQRLGANRAGQGLAMVFVATIPMLVLQSASPQNDLVTSFWVACMVYFALTFAQQPTLPRACAFGIALGLGMLTKGTAYIFAAVVLLGLALWLVARLWGSRHMRGARGGAIADWPWVRALALLGLAGALALALNGWQFAQNYSAFRSPLGPDGQAYANQVFTPPALLCNAARDISLELGVSSAALNLHTYQSVVAVCSFVGVSANDPRISWTGQGGLPFRITSANTYEGTTGNLAEFGLIAVVLALVFVAPRLRRRRRVAAYAALLAAGYALFVCYLRWQPWGNRLLLPWFVAAAPLVGVALDRLLASRLSIPLLELGLVMLATPCLLIANNAPLVGPSTVFTAPRMNQVFISNPGIEQPYIDAAWYVSRRGCQNVGFHSGVEGWEYPFWLLLGPRPYSARIEQVLVANQSARYAGEPTYRQFHPCAIINIVDPTAPEPPVVTFHGATYQLTWSQPSVAIYLPNAPGTAGAPSASTHADRTARRPPPMNSVMDSERWARYYGEAA